MVATDSTVITQRACPIDDGCDSCLGILVILQILVCALGRGEKSVYLTFVFVCVCVRVCVCVLCVVCVCGVYVIVCVVYVCGVCVCNYYSTSVIIPCMLQQG